MSNIQTGAERMPHDLSHLGFLAGQIGRLITISTTPVIAGDSFEMDRSEERFSRNAETDLVCRLLLEKKNKTCAMVLAARPAQNLRKAVEDPIRIIMRHAYARVLDADAQSWPLVFCCD